MRIAVTGASGFVGGAAATALSACGHSVIGFGRTPNGWAGEYRQWDLADGPLTGVAVDAVVHAAALADDWATPSAARAANVDGTRAVIASFRGARFVHISTSSVYDAFTPTVKGVESAPPAVRHLSNYSASKALAETLFQSLDVAILRPHAVYGPGDTTLLPRIVAGIRGSRLVLPNGARVLHTLTHIDNLVDAIALAVQSPARGIFNVGDDGDVLLSDVLTDLLAKQGRADVTLGSIPYRAAYVVAAALEATHKVAGGRPRLTRYAVSQLGLERTLDLSRARELLGYSPRSTSLAGAENW